MATRRAIAKATAGGLLPPPPRLPDAGGGGALLPPASLPVVLSRSDGISDPVPSVTSATSTATPLSTTERWCFWYTSDDEILPGYCCEGFVELSYPSRWITVWDRDGDILAGKYLQVKEKIANGGLRKIDIYSVMVRDQIPMVLESTSPPAEVLDLTADSPVVGLERMRFEGHFWVLAGDDDEDDDCTEMLAADKPMNITSTVTSSSMQPDVVMKPTARPARR
ncbi:hypothetical protein ZWY2020_007997 [Hordeum vulgare]|nr:hypothetical protein ZWY2020_007997 [Hordeum vulgare]